MDSSSTVSRTRILSRIQYVGSSGSAAAAASKSGCQKLRSMSPKDSTAPMPAKPFSSGKQKRAKERARGERAAPDRVDARELDREEDAGHFVDVPAARPGRELAPLVALAAVDGEAGFEERARALARDRGALGDDGREVLAVEGVEAHEEGLHLAGPEGRERRVKVLEVPEHLVARADVEGLGVPVVARAEPRLAHRGADRRLPKRPFPVAVVRRAHELVELDLRSGGSRPFGGLLGRGGNARPSSSPTRGGACPPWARSGSRRGSGFARGARATGSRGRGGRTLSRASCSASRRWRARRARA